jgi:tetratricopeptide (TPR) repeat protein
MRKILLISFYALFLISTYSFGQEDDDMFLDDIGDEKEVICAPEDLSVSFDKFAGTISDKMEVAKFYSFGSEYHKNKNYKDALPLLWKVYLNDNGKRANLAIGKIAESYVNLGFVDSSLIACYKGFEKFPDNQKLHYWAGYIQNKLGRSACAIPHYEALVAKNSNNTSYLSTLAFLYYKEEDERAIDVQTTIVELSPDDPKAQEALANYITSFGGSPREALKDACEKDPTNLRVCRQYAKVSVDEGFFKEAIEILSRIIEQEATIEDYSLRATAYENISKNSNAVNDLNSWLQLEPNNADIMLSIAANYTAMNQFQTSNQWISKAISKKPGYGKPFIVRGEMYEAMVSHCQPGQMKLEDKIVYEEAMFVYEQAKKDPGFRAIAITKVNNLKPHIRLPEERFMEPNAKVTNPCYGFLVGKSGVK